MTNAIAQPSLAHTKTGVVFDPSLDVWKFSTSSKAIKLKFAPLQAWATDELVVSIKAAMAGVLRKYATMTSTTLMEKAVGPLLAHAHARQGERIDYITLAMVQAFALSLDERHQLHLSYVKMLANALALHGNPAHGFSTEATNWLAKQKYGATPRVRLS